MHPFLSTALLLTLRSSRLVLDFFEHGQLLASSQKADQSIVTQADLQSNQFLLEGLEAAFPEHSILSEETGLSGKSQSDWVWVVDPLDGTKAFAKGIAGFSVMLGLLFQGKPYLGVVVDPLENRVYWAVQNEGAFVAENWDDPASVSSILKKACRLKVSTRSSWNTMPWIVSTGFPENDLKRIQTQFNGPFLNPINSVGIKVGLLVRQQGDIYLSHHPVSFWDTVAPEIILKEAGGTLTLLDGTPLKYSLLPSITSSQPLGFNQPILASSGVQHEELVETLKTLGLTFS